MKKDDLSIGELLWLSMDTKSKCPWCGSPISINPKTIGFRMGAKLKDTKGEVTSTTPSYILECPHCGNMIDAKFFVDLQKSE